MKDLKEKYLHTWQKAYDKLNTQQRLAVDTLDGPVMTIAGPGTGKTELLAVRIGNILKNTDVFSHNILCLTFTDAGASAMRQRLESYIGPEAYNVNIYTFHAFCNNVIRENSQYFGDFRELQQVSDLEGVQILKTIVDGFDDNHPLKRFKTDEYFEVERLKKLFKLMKQEEWSPETIRDAFLQYKALIEDPITSPYVYVKKFKDTKTGQEFKPGDLKIHHIDADLKKYSKMVDAASELPVYDQLMHQMDRFDFEDMILWVLKKFKNHDDLLGKYQERYQYILVDEYQDTNGAQNDLIFTLADYWDTPNLFIVGDDDQSIFRFQGANMNSIIDFKEKYNPIEIVLTDNYRSSQKILDRARLLIENNQERLVIKYPHLSKILVESRADMIDAPEPAIIRYFNETQEEIGIINKINQLHENGVPYKDIAIIYTKHRTAENLIRYFSQIKVPLNIKNKVNVLFENDVYKITKILDYLNGEFQRMHSRENLLFEILHYDFFALSALDIGAVSIYCSIKSSVSETTYKNWRNVIHDQNELASAGVKNITAFLKTSSIIEHWISSIPNVTIQTLIEKIITESNMLHQILTDTDKVWKLQLVNTFFDFVKNEAAKSSQMTLRQLVEMIDLMRTSNITLSVNRIISNVGGINFLTAYAVKGLEFEHVFIMRCNENMWEKKKDNHNSYAIIPTLTASSKENNEEDDRRLFYVAMTRSKNYLYISYIEQNDDENKIQLSKFIAEIKYDDKEVIQVEVGDIDVIQYKAELMKYQRGTPQLIDHDLIDRVLLNFKLSVTSLNKYLRCKLSFYFENILRVPLARNMHMGFGNAIHYAFEHFFNDIEMSNPRSVGSLPKLIAFFEKGMDKFKSHFTIREFENLLTHGKQVLTDYYETYASSWLKIPKYVVEYNIPSAEYQGVPISGKLDRIDVFPDHVMVTDYKTGKYDSNKLSGPKNEADPGGDYWRQISFYYILLQGDKYHTWHMSKGVIDFVEKDKLKNILNVQSFDVKREDIDTVSHQIIQTYHGIKNYDFTPGCGEKDCNWCNFVLRNMPVTTLVSDDEASDELDAISESDKIM